MSNDGLFCFHKENNAYIIQGSNISKMHNGILDEFANIEELIIPASFMSLPVTKLGYRSFRGLSQLKTVFVPKTIIAFHGDVFTSCKKLETVVFEKGSKLKTISIYAFYDTSVKTLDIPSGVRSIGYGSFSINSNLMNIFINNFLVTSNIGDPETMFDRISEDVKIYVPVNYPEETFCSKKVIKNH